MADAAKKDDDYYKEGDNTAVKGRRATRKGEIPPQFLPKDDDDDKDKDKDQATKGRRARKGEVPPQFRPKDDDDDDDDKEKLEKETKSVKSRKSDGNGDDDDEDYDDDDDGDDDKSSKARKSRVSSHDLAKSLKALSRLIQHSSSSSRKDSLLAKASNDELSKSERQELFNILGGYGQSEYDLGHEVHKSMDCDGAVPQMVEANDYIEDLHDKLNKSLALMTDAIVAMDERQQEFNLLNGRVLHQSGSLVKSMAQRLGAIEEQPVRGPKSAGIAGNRALNKSFAGTAPAEDSLSKSEVLDALTAMNQQSFAENRGGMSKSNENITHAVSKYEASSRLSPGMVDEVREFIRANRASR